MVIQAHEHRQPHCGNCHSNHYRRYHQRLGKGVGHICLAGNGRGHIIKKVYVQEEKDDGGLDDAKCHDCLDDVVARQQAVDADGKKRQGYQRAV